jgi:hypothetical protein
MEFVISVERVGGMLRPDRVRLKSVNFMLRAVKFTEN